MLNRGIVARKLASSADLYIIRVAEQGVVRQIGGILEVGPGASDDEIVTIGAQRHLALRGIFDERQVRSRVEFYGYAYIPECLSERSAS